MATSNQQAADQCPECAGRVVTNGTEHCTDCGLVVEDTPIDHGPDWRSFDDDRNRKRTKAGDRTYIDDGMGSEIGLNEDFSERQRRINGHAKQGGKRQRNKGYLTGEARRIASALDLDGTLTEQAAQLAATLVDQTDDLLGKDLDTVAATCVYSACRVHQRGLAPEDVAAVARDVDRKLLLRRHSWLCETLGLTPPPPAPEQRIRRVAADAGLSDSVRDRALWMCDRLDEYERQRPTPSALAATLLYLAGEHVTQQTVGDAASVTPSTIRDVRDRLPDLSGQQTIDQF